MRALNRATCESQGKSRLRTRLHWPGAKPASANGSRFPPLGNFWRTTFCRSSAPRRRRSRTRYASTRTAWRTSKLTPNWRTFLWIRSRRSKSRASWRIGKWRRLRYRLWQPGLGYASARAFHLAAEWGKVSTILPRVRLLAGENHRERVLTAEEEREYLDAATAIGHGLSEAYHQALEGI